MKLATGLLAALMAVSLSAPAALAQEQGDYRTRNSGDWTMAQNWERFNGSTWAAVATPPTGSETITVREADSIYVNAAVTITGQVVNRGRLANNADDALLTFGDGGVYQHDRDEGTIPEATWAEGSTLHLTGVTAVAPADRNQSYHHVIFETPGLAGNLNMNLDDVTIGGDIIVRDTGFGRWYLTSASANEGATVTIMGDVIVEQGNFSVHGTGNVGTTFVVEHYGDVVVSGGNFSISRGSQPLGTTTWRLHEGDFRMSNAVTQNSVSTPRGGRFVFTSGETQVLELGEGNTLTSLPIEVRDGTTLDMGSSALAGSGHFFLEAGSVLATALPGGVAAVFPATVTGEVELEDGSGYLFHGTEAQVTSERMPGVVGELIIDNEAGVTLSKETLINETLRLQAGTFDNTIPFTLGPDASIEFAGGSLVVAVSAEDGAGLAEGFRVDQNYPNPFAGSTSIRFTLPEASRVSVAIYNVLGQRVMNALDDAPLAGGPQEISVDLSGLSSGVYVYRVQTEFGEESRRMIRL